jgi:ATP-dependent Clp protease ATP-binding subunit ClpA
MFERFTKSARQVVTGSREQADDLGHRFIGTEHLLLSLLATEGPDPARDALREAGIGSREVRADIMRLIGPGQSDDDAPDDLDIDALRAIGIDPDVVRAKLEATFGAGAMDRLRASDLIGPRRGRRIGLTRRAKKVIELSLREAVRLRSSSIDTPHILLGLLREGDGLGVRVLREHGVDLADLRRRAEASLDQAA